ncbi:GTPase ObgE [archaeon]|nr:GTPase ObgE [archaeon]
MSVIESKIKEIEDEIRKTHYNKATQHHIGRLKAKLAMLREQSESRSGSSGRGSGFNVSKSGDATVVLVGFPSVGKSTILNKITPAESEVGSYEFTTLDVVPGMMEHRGAKIQILDIPGIVRGASHGKGRGREVLAAVRSADLILFIVDVFNIEQLKFLTNELRQAGIRLNSQPPLVRITVRDRGGIDINTTVNLTKIDSRTIKAILSEYRIHNCNVIVREDLDEERFIDALAKNRVYIPAFDVLNKIDLVNEGYLREVESLIDTEYIAISAEKDINMEKLKSRIYEKLNFIRIYMKPQGKKADMVEPLIVMRGIKIEGVSMKIHRDFREKFKHARVWGKSVSFPGQRVGLDHEVKDGDIITIVVKR